MNKTPSALTSRNSAIELLRIVAIIFIVLSHICHHSGFDYTYSIMTLNRLFVQFGILGNLGVAIFVMISGYFLCRKPFRPKTVSRLFAQVWFYSISLFLLCKFGFGYSYSAPQLLAVFFPTVFNEYWFFTAYIVLLLLTPFLNILLNALSRQQFQAMLGCMLFLWVLIPTLTRQQMYAGEIPQFVLYYSLGAYFQLYPDNPFRNKWLRLGLTVGSFLLLMVLTVVLGYLERYTPAAFGAANRFYDRNSLIIAGCATGLFTLAVYWKPFFCPFINTLGGCTFGVYLIHDNPAVREILWKQLLNQNAYFTSGSFIPRIVLCVLAVFSVCSALEFLRQKTVAAPMTNGLHRLLSLLWRNAESIKNK